MGKPKLIDPKFVRAIPIFRDKRSAETNLRILETLALDGKLSITDIHKKMPKSPEVTRWRKTTRRKTYPGSRRDYSTIKRRVSDLERQYYVKEYRKEPSQKHGKKKRIMGLTEKGWWVANLVSAKVRSEWRKAYKNYEEEFEERESSNEVNVLKMMVNSPSMTENLFYIFTIKPFRDLMVSGYVDLDMIGEDLPDNFYEKSVFFLRDAMEYMRKPKRERKRHAPSWIKCLTREEHRAFYELFCNPQLVQLMDETEDKFKHEWKRILRGTSQKIKKFQKRQSKNNFGS